MKQVVHTDHAPKALVPYSQAIKANGMVFCSGQIGLNPASGDFAGNDVATQCKQVMDNLKAVLTEAGSHLDQVVKTTIFLADMNDFSTVNEIYGSYFSQAFPARETVAVKTLPKNALVEISVIALVG
jgi:2-iminobutanoate/2-iminopropanoate deaminase